MEMEPTEAGRKAIENNEYRYLSPVYELMRWDRKTGKKLKDWRLHSVALTNVPFLTELPAIKNREGEDSMEELLKLLGAESEEQAISKVNELKEANAANEAKVSTLTAELETANAKIQEAQTQANAAAVENAIASGKLVPAQKELAVKLINQDRALYDEFVANAGTPADLGKEIKVGEGEGDGLDRFKEVQSYGELLKDPAKLAAMKAENIKLHDELYNRGMKEGR